MAATREHERLLSVSDDRSGWRRWGPYVADRAWGTVREDYSPDGDAWGYFPHDLARSKAYRWGEDGLVGICDRYQVLVFALALWNERDPILKERLFGLVPAEGNHGEDVKEYYFYLDNTPTHSYMKCALQVPAGASIPTAARRREPAAGRTRARVRAPGHRDLRRRPLLRRLRGVREGRPRGHRDPHHGLEPWPRSGAAPPAAPPLVPQHLGVEREKRPPSRTSERGRRSAAPSPSSPTTASADPVRGLPFLSSRARDTSTLPERGGRSSRTTRRTPPACSGPWREAAVPTSRTRSTGTS